MTLCSRSGFGRTLLLNSLSGAATAFALAGVLVGTDAHAQTKTADTTATTAADHDAAAEAEADVSSDGSADATHGSDEAHDPADKVHLHLAVTTDTFFGFAPLAAGVYQAHKVVGFSFYGIYWAGGTGGAWGNWGEFGFGVNLVPTDGLSIRPQLGIVNGNLLSKGAADGQAVFADGIVPSLTVGLSRIRGVEGELYFGYYAPLRTFEDPETGDDYDQQAYVHYWANLGYAPIDFLSFGAHWEHLWGGVAGEGDDVYQWIGPYAQFSHPKGKFFFRITAGADIGPADDSFWKMTTGLNF